MCVMSSGYSQIPGKRKKKKNQQHEKMKHFLFVFSSSSRELHNAATAMTPHLWLADPHDAGGGTKCFFNKNYLGRKYKQKQLRYLKKKKSPKNIGETMDVLLRIDNRVCHLFGRDRWEIDSTNSTSTH